MIKLSTKSRYGLRILLHIAEEGRSGRLAHGREIAARQEITGPYLEQIMIPLKAGQLVKARRGCRGYRRWDGRRARERRATRCARTSGSTVRRRVRVAG